MKNKKLLILIIAFSLIAATSYFLLNDTSMNVNVIKVYKGSITKSIEISGTINSADVETIPLEPSMEVVDTYVKENDFVEKNQLLAELDAEELNISLQKTMITIEDLNDRLNDITSDKSDLILLSNNVSKIKEEYSRLGEDLNAAKEDLSKAEILYNESAISKTEYDKYVTVVNNLESSLKTSEINLKDASVKYSNSEEQKIKDKLSLERQIKSLNLDLESLNNKIENTKIYSSIDGIVTEFPLEKSRKTLSGQNIIIHGTSAYELNALVAQQDAVFINEGQKSIVTVEGLNTNYEGVVKYVSKIAQTDNSGSMLPKVEIKIEIINPDNSLSFGFEGEAKIIIDTLEDDLVVKNESVKKEGNKDFVYIIKNNTAKKLYVETGLTDGYLVQIKEGLSENDLVIVNPPVDLVDGMKVKYEE